MANRPKHPGKTAAQRRALDQIGCGDFCPYMARKTRDALLAAGLIIEAGDKVIGRDSFGAISLPQYAMPISVHIQWCEAVASDDTP